MSSKKNLRKIRSQLHSINDVLASTPVTDLGAEERARLTQSCHRVNATYSGEYGEAIRAAEDREA